MQPIKEKLSNMASAAKEQANIAQAKAEEKIEKAAARTPEEREIAHERRKAKEAQAKMEFHEEKPQHKADRLEAKQHSHLYGGRHHQQQHGEYACSIPTPGGEYPMGGATTAGAAPTTGVSVPSRPVGGNQADRLDAKQQPHLYDHQQHGEYKNPIPTPGGEYPMGGATTAGAAPMSGVAGQQADRLDAKQQPYLHVHHHRHQHDEYEYPIPTSGGEHPIGGATTGMAAPTTDPTYPTRPAAGQPPTTKYISRSII